MLTPPRSDRPAPQRVPSRVAEDSGLDPPPGSPLIATIHSVIALTISRELPTAASGLSDNHSARKHH